MKGGGREYQAAAVLCRDCGRGQITAAAEWLHVSQPPLSYELAKLEEELGTKLAKRFIELFSGEQLQAAWTKPLVRAKRA